jgi:transposase
MAKPLVSDELWAVVEPLLPPTRPSGTRGHPPVPNRVALTGSRSVLETGSPWESFPLQQPADAGEIDWSRASADASRVPATRGAARPGRTRPTGASRAASTA